MLLLGERNVLTLPLDFFVCYSKPFAGGEKN